MKRAKQVLSIILCMIMVIGVLPTSFASDIVELDNKNDYVAFESDYITDDITNEIETDASQALIPIGELNKEDHNPFISGSKGLFLAGGNLTRAQTSQIIYNLIVDKYEGIVFPNNFPDVVEHSWYETPVILLNNMGVINGYSDGTFRPNANITRAEFVTILAKFFPEEKGTNSYVDVEKDSWAEKAIITATVNGWVSGYEGNKFMPGKFITRAEAVKIMNKALGREPDKKSINSIKRIIFPDLKKSHWAYYEILEASIGHYYKFNEDGSETWSYFDIPQTSMSEGIHYIDGEVYYVKRDGNFAADEVINGWQYDSECKYTSGDVEVDRMIKELIVKLSTPEMSRMEILHKLYDYTCSDLGYRTSGKVDAGETDWELRFAKEMLTNGKSNCYGYAAVIAMFARQLGYEAYGISGQCYDTDKWVLHGWTDVYVDGELYLCDSEMEAIFAPREGYKWDLFMKKYGETPTSYRKKGK